MLLGIEPDQLFYGRELPGSLRLLGVQLLFSLLLGVPMA
jgi:hypothetical protein